MVDKNNPHTWPSFVGRNGIFIGVQLEIDAQQLETHRIGWAGATMRTAAEHIRQLENLIDELKGGQNGTVT